MRKAFFLCVCVLLFIFVGSVPAEAETVTTVNRVDTTNYPTLYVAQPLLEGETVWMLEARLKELGYDIIPTGQYTYTTGRTVQLFQAAQGLKDDGVVTRPVWETLMFSEPGEVCLAETEGNNEARMLIVIDVATRTLTLYENDEVVQKFPVAVGKSKTPTPLGEWRVVQKCLNWGSGFGTRWMGLNVPWGIYGIHGTNKPGSIGTYASHGCIRMFNRDVEKLYPLIPMNTRVRIVDNGKMFPQNFKPVKLKKQMSGQNVVYLQNRLKELGVEFDRADGRFGNMTELAVKYFQVWHNIEPTGEVDEETYRAMGMIE
ncbi:MAG: peptidoglycan-binding protein [Syntrophomonadaceae bacterium]|nr:peptidoglycan-binding protein [Syntrophomonadaceae bacterium]